MHHQNSPVLLGRPESGKSTLKVPIFVRFQLLNFQMVEISVMILILMGSYLSYIWVMRSIITNKEHIALLRDVVVQKNVKDKLEREREIV